MQIILQLLYNCKTAALDYIFAAQINATPNDVFLRADPTQIIVHAHLSQCSARLSIYQLVDPQTQKRSRRNYNNNHWLFVLECFTKINGGSQLPSKIKRSRCQSNKENGILKKKTTWPRITYADVFLDPAPGEHPVQLRSESLLRQQGEDDGIRDDHLRILQYDLSVDSQHHLANFAFLRAHFLTDGAAVEEVAQSTTATKQRGIVQED